MITMVQSVVTTNYRQTTLWKSVTPLSSATTGQCVINSHLHMPLTCLVVPG